MDQVSKSKVFFDGLLPGGVHRMRNNTYIKIMGALDNSAESKLVDRVQLLAVVKKVVKEWDEMPNAKVDIQLRTALEDPASNLEVVCPGSLYANPFPIMLRCNKCGVLNYHQPYKSEKEMAESAKKRINNVNVIPCFRSDCNGVMKQNAYVAIHRCGNMTPIDIPFKIRSIKNLGFSSQSGSFLNSFFYDVDSKKQLAHALQQKCESCKNEFDISSKQGRPASGSDILYPHFIQYLSLKEETAKLVSKTSALVETQEDLANAITSTLIGLSDAEALAQLMEDILNGESGDSESLIEQLAAKKIERDGYQDHKNSMPEAMFNSIMDNANQLIDDLEKKLGRSSGRYREVRDYFPESTVINQLGSTRRAIEAALLPYDYKLERDTLAKQVEREVDPIRKDALIQDVAILNNRYGIREIAHYRAINVVLACYGYTRELRQPVEEGEGVGHPPTTLNGFEDQVQSSLAGKRIVYALPAQTEAIQVHLDPCRILIWCIEQAGWADPGNITTRNRQKAHAYLLANSLALQLEPSEVILQTKDLPLHDSAPFHLMHTISHCLISTIKRHTGYDEKRVMEYLIPMDLSIILYVASVQNYTAGGLLGMFNHHLKDWFDEASNYAFNCIFDPLCSDRGASCSGCIQTVMGCETFNHGLSRSYLHGGRVDEEDNMIIKQGFWGS
ncbi:MAG: hypothetical protein HOE44_17240 [Candidatus Marinimicrobia bacterium]|jgi:hypothetical protein|nr:hypothetical protein [Candidatus Neomarinimicrobiota bacterium]MBT5270710.1 hypothetical protein [Candidatus Neomarinimicrobiota bacterium]MBT7831144.1 hypothetical protein [Candidatus Neomarinimicrobiota bacterium]